MKNRSPPCEGLRLHPVYGSLSAILLDPVAFIIFLVLLLYGAPGDAVSAIFLTVLIFGGVEGLFVDLLGVPWQVVLHVVRQLRYLLVGHPAPCASRLALSRPVR